MRLQSAMPLSMLRDDFGFRRRRRPRRSSRRREAEPSAPEPAEAELVPVAAPSPVPNQEWGPLTRLGQQLRVQAKRGFRAAVVELQPGLFLVAEVPEASLRPQFGLVPVLAPLPTLAAARALRRRARREAEAEVVYEAPQAEPQVPAWWASPQAEAAAPVRWASPEDVETLAGCPRRGCRRGR